MPWWSVTSVPGTAAAGSACTVTGVGKTSSKAAADSHAVAMRWSIKVVVQARSDCLPVIFASGVGGHEGMASMRAMADPAPEVRPAAAGLPTGRHVLLSQAHDEALSRPGP